MSANSFYRFENIGRAADLVLAEGPVPVPGPGQVLIKVAAAGLNRADLLQGRGAYPPPPGAPDIPGLEVSGIIAAVGDGVTGFAPGMAVCALMAGGGYARMALADAGSVLPVPAGVSMTDAAGLPEACFTAWTNVVDSGRLAEAETLLVHGGTSGIGVMAIQIFASLGHKVLATAGTDEKCAACVRLGAARAICYPHEDFVAAVKEATIGTGIDVILDMVGGPYIQRNIAAAAHGGRIVNIAYQQGARAEVDFAPVLRKALTLTATTLRPRPHAQKRLIRDALLARVWPLLAAGTIRPVTARAFPFASASQALAALAQGGHVGKIILEL